MGASQSSSVGTASVRGTASARGKRKREAASRRATRPRVAKATQAVPKRLQGAPASPGVVGALVASDAAGVVAAYLSTGDNLRLARCAGAAFLEAYSSHLEVFDVGFSKLRPFLASDRPGACRGLVAVLARSPRLRSLSLSHLNFVDFETLSRVSIGHLERLGLRNCFRLSNAELCEIIERCPNLRALDVSKLTFPDLKRDLGRLLELTPKLETLCVSCPDGFADAAAMAPLAVGVPTLRCLEFYDPDCHPGLDVETGLDVEQCEAYPWNFLLRILTNTALQGITLEFAFWTDTEHWTATSHTDLVSRVEEFMLVEFEANGEGDSVDSVDSDGSLSFGAEQEYFYAEHGMDY